MSRERSWRYFEKLDFSISTSGFWRHLAALFLEGRVSVNLWKLEGSLATRNVQIKVLV